MLGSLMLNLSLTHNVGTPEWITLILTIKKPKSVQNKKLGKKLNFPNMISFGLELDTVLF